MAQIYRVGKDIFDASTNKKIANPTVLATQYKGATEIKAPNLNVPTGATKILNTAGLQGLNESQLYRSGKDIYKLPSAISSDMITGGTAPTIKPVEQSFTDTKPYVAGLDTTTKGLESLVSTALTPTPQESKVSPITSKITELTGQFEQKPVDYQVELDKYGFKTNVQDLQNLNTQIASKKAEYDSAIQSQEGRAGLAGSIYGRQSLLARQSAIELGGLSSMAQALQGNVQMAQNIADKTIAIKYEPVEQEIANQKFQLEQVYEQLSRDEKKKADALKITLDERQILIDDEKETEANINKIMTAAAQNGADTNTLQKIMSAKDVNQAVINAGQYLAEAQSGQPTEIGDNLYYDPSTQSVVTGEQLVSGVVIPKSSRLAFVNNNPGNLRYAGQAGASQGEGGFARFESPEAGYEALKNQISLDASRGLTLEKFINKYAPPSENDTNLYIQQAVATLGVDKSTKLSDINLDAIAQFMANKESGTKISTSQPVIPGTTTTPSNVSVVTGKPLTQTELQSQTFANRLNEANSIISRLESKFTSANLGNVLSKTSIFGFDLLPEAFKSEDRKLIEQAQRNFINAVLRKESGAAISDSEFNNAEKQYFPQIGDTEKVLEQKKKNRQTVIDGMMLAGGSYPTENKVLSEDEAYQEYLKTTKK
jgi:hypothetical protein